MPTRSTSSPTTTSAVNEKRRPPLTTFATRLISTTRSWRSRPSRSRGMRPISVLLESEAALAGAIRQGRHAAVVEVAAAIEDDPLDAFVLGPLGDELADLRRPLLLGAGGAVQLLRGGGGDGGRRRVVDQLGVDALVGAEDRQARPLGRAGDLAADPLAPLEAALFLG